MLILKFLSLATLLCLASGCRSSASADWNGQPRWARHEAGSQTHTNSGPLAADDHQVRGYNDDSSRTFQPYVPTPIRD